jgi:predicted amidohydrolase
VANFPEKRIRNWDILLQARAIENQCYVCGVNCVGVDGAGISYNGHSVLLDYLANTLLSFTEHEIGTATFELNKEMLEKFRSKSPFWKDADKFIIQD